MKKTSVGIAILGTLLLSGCSMVTDVDRSEIPDDLFIPLDASLGMDAGMEEPDAGPDLDATSALDADGRDAGLLSPP